MNKISKNIKKTSKLQHLTVKTDFTGSRNSAFEYFSVGLNCAISLSTFSEIND